ncbi:hypothetical protein [Pseudomonas petrae]|uniref:Uncharacterized protein n=1 Tax=Pseudomonas petrae TaxID=2912190 RepID=A0ABS9I8B1_9PSED|nr:hypothetical protein [Pseudomonas petrae]MCF7534126.1 hypothetical protein [Pseudomonas petrae]MCF7538024.1 hypothetical protein [Pseudomonas petrae]MCF7543333.1 hypothetical protein [Pseudomonas petrae]MCF7555371.1 hypothetical protein [Pseudomonas petrae]
MSSITRDALRTATLYGLVSMVWLAISDYLLPRLIGDATLLTRAQQTGGYLWLAVSAVLIYLARSRLLRFMGVMRRCLSLLDTAAGQAMPV